MAVGGIFADGPKRGLFPESGFSAELRSNRPKSRSWCRGWVGKRWPTHRSISQPASPRSG